jgi:predicted lipoprotein with Yx(FWY)xxD motif
MRTSITRFATTGFAIAGAALVLAACGGGDDGSGNATAAAPSGNPGLVSIQKVDGTDVLADAGGRTLYSANVEKARIRCTGGCTSFWDPVHASASQAKSESEQLKLDLGVTDRPDGAGQLTMNGLPLYTFTQEQAGQLQGDGFVDDFNGTHFEWAAATTHGASAPMDSGSSNSPSPY